MCTPQIKFKRTLPSIQVETKASKKKKEYASLHDVSIQYFTSPGCDSDSDPLAEPEQQLCPSRIIHPNRLVELFLRPVSLAVLGSACADREISERLRLWPLRAADAPVPMSSPSAGSETPGSNASGLSLNTPAAGAQLTGLLRDSYTTLLARLLRMYDYEALESNPQAAGPVNGVLRTVLSLLTAPFTAGDLVALARVGQPPSPPPSDTVSFLPLFAQRVHTCVLCN